MERNDYVLEYTLYHGDGSMLKHGKMKVKNRLSELDAKVKLEIYFRKKYNFQSIVIHDCYRDNDFMNMFKNIFNQK